MAELHSSIIAMVSLASGIASNHPAMGQCQLAKLRHMGISEDQLNTVIEVARHIRDEASEKLDVVFDKKSKAALSDDPEMVATATDGEACCSSTTSGTSCC